MDDYEYFDSGEQGTFGDPIGNVHELFGWHMYVICYVYSATDLQDGCFIC